MEQLGGLEMWTTNPIFGRVKYVVRDSGFCVMKGLVGMLAHGVYGMAETKKNNWTKYCKGDVIEACLRDKKVGDVHSVCSDIDGHK